MCLTSMSLSDIPLSGALKLAIPDLPKKASWMSINPRDIVEKLDGTFDLGTMREFFLRVSESRRGRG